MSEMTREGKGKELKVEVLGEWEGTDSCLILLASTPRIIIVCRAAHHTNMTLGVRLFWAMDCNCS